MLGRLPGWEGALFQSAGPPTTQVQWWAEDIGLGLENARLELVSQLPLPDTVSKNNKGSKLEKARILSYFMY